MDDLSGSQENELIAELEALNAFEVALKKEDGLSYYTPNKHQLKAHQSDARMVLVCGAN